MMDLELLMLEPHRTLPGRDSVRLTDETESHTDLPGLAEHPKLQHQNQVIVSARPEISSPPTSHLCKFY